MPNWIRCAYYAGNTGPGKPGSGIPVNDEPVNLSMCETFKRIDLEATGQYLIEFRFLRNAPIVWEFMDAASRDREYERALDLINKNG